MRKLLLATTALTMSLSASVMAHDHSEQSNSYKLQAPVSSMENLCYLKEQDTKTSYHYKASLYGLSRHDLQQAESSYVCQNGQVLGQIENRWRNRNS
tara:strand:- start:207 stop:497 length:291 start_codon:yes stop_codon:yes gene_type:complete